MKPLFSSAKWTLAVRPAGTWDPPTAETEFQQALTAHPGINSVLMPNDETAAPVITYLKTLNIPARKFPVTGQDATLVGLQNIISGYQCGTVYKPIYVEAQAAAALALYLRAGKTPPKGLVNGSSTDPQTNTKVASVLLKPQWVTPTNVESTVIKDQFVTVGEAVRTRPCRPTATRVRQHQVEPAKAAEVVTDIAGSSSPTDYGDDVGSLLSLRGISKSFGAVRALEDVNLDIPAGKVTALVGDNGAGKSTLIKTVSGIWQPSAGEILWNGKPADIRTPRDADARGIATVYQDLALCDNLDIVQNMYLGHELLRWGLLDENKMEITARQVLSDLSVTTVQSIRQPVGSLSGGQRQAVAVARAVMRDAKLVILDEPTAALRCPADRPGPGPDHDVGVPGYRRHGGVPQPQRRVRRGRPDSGTPPRPYGEQRAGRRL